MKIIFLDIDGVICNKKCLVGKYEDNHHFFDSNCTKLLDEIVEKTNASIIITSSWRRGDLKWLKGLFKIRGFKNYKKIIGETERKIDCPRGWEIRSWLMKRKYEGKNNINNYVIIDDDADMLYEQKDNFVRTDTAKGLTTLNKNKIIKILIRRRKQ